MNIYKNNTRSSFREAFPGGVVLDGSWEVALSKIVYPSIFNNFVGGQFDFFGQLERSGHKVVKYPLVCSEQRPL